MESSVKESIMAEGNLSVVRRYFKEISRQARRYMVQLKGNLIKRS
jgi:hypothetical protein